MEALEVKKLGLIGGIGYIIYNGAILIFLIKCLYKCRNKQTIFRK